MKLFGKIPTKKLLYSVCIFLIAIVVTTFYRKEIREMFSNGSSISYSIGDGVRSSWLYKDKNSKDRTVYSKMECNVAKTNSDLSEDNILIFKDNKFSADCCPSSYTSSSGCLCVTPEQMKYLNSHGGNKTLGGAQIDY